MKIILIAFILAFLPISSNALRRINGPTPVLHSILDKDTPDQAASPGNYISDDDGWSRRFSAGPAQMPDYIRYAPTSRDVMRRRGIGLTIAGGTILTGGGALWLYADAETRRQQASGGRTYTGTYYILALMILLVGVVLTLVGLPIWLTHLEPKR